jgi:hypothetical protein
MDFDVPGVPILITVNVLDYYRFFCLLDFLKRAYVILVVTRFVAATHEFIAGSPWRQIAGTCGAIVLLDSVVFSINDTEWMYQRIKNAVQEINLFPCITVNQLAPPCDQSGDAFVSNCVCRTQMMRVNRYLFIGRLCKNVTVERQVERIAGSGN